MGFCMSHTIKAVVLGLSLLLVGVCYAQDFQKGNDAYVKKDYATALREWRPLAERGDARALREIRLLADQGNVSAQASLGDMYYNGWGVITKDNKEGLKWYRLAAEQGDARAQASIGWFYWKGIGFLQDYKEALKWFHLSAEQGNSNSFLRLADMYADGQGVILDNVYAHMWLNIAASSDDASAVAYAVWNREIVAGKMTTADISKAQDLARECVKKKYKGC